MTAQSFGKRHPFYMTTETARALIAESQRRREERKRLRAADIGVRAPWVDVNDPLYQLLRNLQQGRFE